MRKITEIGTGVNVVVLADFKVRENSYMENGKQITYNQNYAHCTFAQLKIIDHAKSDN